MIVRAHCSFCMATQAHNVEMSTGLIRIRCGVCASLNGRMANSGDAPEPAIMDWVKRKQAKPEPQPGD